MSVAFSLNAFAKGLLQILSWVTCGQQKINHCTTDLEVIGIGVHT